MWPKVTIIILNWNGKEDTIECLESLKPITYQNYEILLVDNGSTDGSVELFKEKYPEIELIENEENLGYAEGNNAGIRKAIDAGTDYVLILNNDTIVNVDLDFIEKLVQVAESDSKIGLIGPKICYYDYPDKIWSVGGTVNLFSCSIKNDYNLMNEKRLKGNRVVDYVTGCALLIKRGVLDQIGLLDKDYFLYFEETDLNLRAYKKGYLSVINCDATILHKSGASIKKVKDSNYYYFARNSLLFLKKNGNWYHYITYIPIYALKYGSMIAFNLIKGNYHRCSMILSGTTDCIRGKYGPYR